MGKHDKLIAEIGYYNHPYYRSEAYKRKLEMAMQQELARQDLCSKKPTLRALQYAKFLTAVENDATYSKGRFERFRQGTKEELVREWPFLIDSVERFRNRAITGCEVKIRTLSIKEAKE